MIHDYFINYYLRLIFMYHEVGIIRQIVKWICAGLNIQTVPEFFGKWKETSRTDKGWRVTRSFPDCWMDDNPFVFHSRRSPLQFTCCNKANWCVFKEFDKLQKILSASVAVATAVRNVNRMDLQKAKVLLIYQWPILLIYNYIADCILSPLKQ